MNINKLSQTIRATVFTIATVTATATTPSTPVVGAAAAMSIFALSSTPALAAQCKRSPITATGSARAVFNRAGIRRAKRKAIRKWQRAAKAKFGRKFDDFDDARNVRFIDCKAIRVPGQSTFQSCTVRANACNG